MATGKNKPRDRSARGPDSNERRCLPADGDAAWFLSLVESSSDAIISEDPHGRIVTWNAGAERLLGYATAEVIGRSIVMVCAPDGTDEVRHIREQLKRDRCVPPRVMHWCRKNGERMVVSVGFSAMRDSAGEMVGLSVIARELNCNVADISERRQAEEALRESDERTRSIVDNIIDGIITIDESGVIQSVNAAVGRVFGYSRDELIGRNITALMPEPYRANHDAYLGNYFRTGVAQVIGIGREVEGLRRDGSTFPMDLSVGEFHFGGRRYFTGVVRDITERKRTEAALRESEGRFRALADNAPVKIWISGADKRCTWFNKRWLDFRGRTMDQECGEGWLEGVHRDDVTRCLDTYVTSFDARVPFTMEYRLRRHDGEYRYLLDIGIPITDGYGHFAGYVGSCIDITDRIRAEQAIRDSERIYRAIGESIPYGVWICDPHGRNTYTSDVVPPTRGPVPGAVFPVWLGRRASPGRLGPNDRGLERVRSGPRHLGH